MRGAIVAAVLAAVLALAGCGALCPEDEYTGPRGPYDPRLCG